MRNTLSPDQRPDARAGARTPPARRPAPHPNRRPPCPTSSPSPPRSATPPPSPPHAAGSGCPGPNAAPPGSSSGEAAGLLVRLPGWLYPVVVDTADGQVRFDNYDGRWGRQEDLDRFLQAYAVEKATAEARKRGHSVTEQALADGSVKLTIQVGGAS